MTYSQRDVQKLMKKNGFERVPNRGKGSHSIYSNGNRTISICRSCNTMIIRRLIKEYGLTV